MAERKGTFNAGMRKAAENDALAANPKLIDSNIDPTKLEQFKKQLADGKELSVEALASLSPAERNALAQFTGLAGTAGDVARKGINSTYVMATQTDTILTDIQAVPNPLNVYANYTYHVKFSMVDATQAYTVDSKTNLSSLNQIIIAESGATAAFNVTKFNIVNTVSPGFKHQNQNLMTWKMTITEPYGLTMPDYILAAAKQLNIKNASRFPFFIEVWFNGYDENGNISSDKVAYKSWRVMMLDMALTAGHVGTTYDLNGVADGNIGSTNQVALTPATVIVDGIKTVKQGIDKLAESLNKAQSSAENKKSSVNITYKIEIPKEIESWQLESTTSDADSQKNGSFNGVNSTKNGNEMPINRGQDIGKFVTYLVSKCGAKADAYLYGTNGMDSTPSSDKNGLGTVLQVFTQLKLGNYNNMMNDYDKEITYKILPFSTPRIVADPVMAQKQEELPIQQQKVKYLKEANLLKKRYEYIYTGKNTEVIKFDIHIENFWAISLPTYLGASSYGQHTQGAVVDAESVGFRENKGYGGLYKLSEEISARVQELDKQIKSAAGGASSGNLLSNLSAAQNAISQLSNMSTSIQNLAQGKLNTVSQLNAAASSIGKLALLSSPDVTSFDSGIANNLNSLLSKVKQAEAQINPAANYRGGRYLEDIKSGIENDDPIKVAFFVDNEPSGQNGTTGGSEAKASASAVSKAGGMPPSASKMGTTMQNLYDQNQMLEIELEIRGDPWWIGMSNLEENDYAGTNKSGPTDQADFLKGENMFVLSFKTGSNYDEATGMMKFNSSSNYFNGTYAVMEVENRFENGSFTQVLKAYKELFQQKVSQELTPKVETAAAAPAAPNQTPISQNSVNPATGNFIGIGGETFVPTFGQ